MKVILCDLATHRDGSQKDCSAPPAGPLPLLRSTWVPAVTREMLRKAALAFAWMTCLLVDC